MITQLGTDAILSEPDRSPTITHGRSAHGPNPVMTAARLEELRDELERLRRRTARETVESLRAARSYGDGSNNDEYHAIQEEQMVLEARTALLENTIARAIIVDADSFRQGAAAIGSLVLIEDLGSGIQSQYRLTSAHQSLSSNFISAASPMGAALIGAMPGAIATVELPNGRSKSVRLVNVETPQTT